MFKTMENGSSYAYHISKSLHLPSEESIGMYNLEESTHGCRDISTSATDCPEFESNRPPHSSPTTAC